LYIQVKVVQKTCRCRLVLCSQR